LPGVDRLAVELERASRSAGHLAPPAVIARWEAVYALAKAAGDNDAAATAQDEIGVFKILGDNRTRAMAHFESAAALRPPHRRAAQSVAYHGRLLHDKGETAAAIALLQATLRGRQGSADGDHALLLEQLAEFQAAAGDHAAAYASLREALRYRAAPGFKPSFIEMTRVPRPSEKPETSAAEFAAVRNALREAELERARLLQRQTAGLATVAVLLAALLGLAYAYKRRTAAALAAQRDAAELRADRIRWQMLRYQLSPHFLFNALSSLGGLVATDAPAARRVVDRLSEFCQLALKGANDSLRPLGQEMESIRAYLDVELAGHGDSMRVAYDLDPAAAAFPVPPLLLQPLAENAIKYGAQTSEDLLEIRISAHLEDAGLRLEVANTGRWVAADARPRHREAVGLANVRERLARLGASADALTTTASDGWVRVAARLPRASTPPA
jgi:tetratricopeptide (TPR) repeat protein